MNISDKEKKQLKDKITLSVSSYIRRRRYLKYGLGFAAAFVIGFFALINNQNTNPQLSPMDKYVKSLEGSQNADEIQLLLGNNQNVRIAESEASISYSNSGEKVTIGNSQSINQKTLKNQNIVFNTLIVPYGKRSSIELADGSKVWLNSGSKLVFPAKFSKKTREVYLEGEAIFEVSHDNTHPFIVTSGEQTIEVLGTVFNVSSYEDDAEISTVLKSGSIKISHKDSQLKNSTMPIILEPKTLALYNINDESITTKAVDVEKYFSWRDGIFIFKNDSLKSIMKKISRYYNIEITINNKELANATFSGYLDVKDNVENVIKVIQETTRFNYSITDNKLIIN